MMWLLIILFSFMTFQAQGQSLAENARSVKALGMGGVFIPFVRGADAIFYNPAALGKSPLLDIRLLDLNIGVNSFTAENVTKIQDIDPDDSSTYNDFFGKKIWLQTTGKVAVSLPYLAMGYLYDAEVSTELHNQPFQYLKLILKMTKQSISVEHSRSADSYLGMAVKRVTRWGGSTQDLGITTIANANNLQAIGDNFKTKVRVTDWI